MLGNRLSQHKLGMTPQVHMARSQFDRSFAMKDTFNFDYLTPHFVDEVVPGDTMNVSMNMFARLATQKVPIMDNLYIDFFYFFVPTRLIWDNWEKFNGAQTNPGDSTDFVIPQTVTTAGTGEIVGSVTDKFGIPTQVPGLSVNALPYRAYYLIWNNWFRDENLQNSLTVPKDNGPDTISAYTLQKRGKRFDYFTSCLPTPQKGPAVTLPLGTSAPVILSGTGIPSFDFGSTHGVNLTQPTPGGTGVNTSTGTVASTMKWNTPNLLADLSTASSATINQLRQAFSIQSMYELDNRGGTRYVEVLLAHFNVVSPDFRLQRPEYLGGGQSRINSHPVPQTAPTAGSNPQAQLAAFGTSSKDGIGFTHSFVEHGYVLGFMCARADLTYQQGLNRMWSRSTRFDFFWPKLQEIGEQAVLNKEIYAQGSANPTADAAAFGYQERYAEYRYKPSEIHGQFRSNYATSLDVWHQAEYFGSAPALNSTFITSNTPITRALSVTNTDQIIIDTFTNFKHARPMMTYSVPSTLGKF